MIKKKSLTKNGTLFFVKKVACNHYLIVCPNLILHFIDNVFYHSRKYKDDGKIKK